MQTMATIRNREAEPGSDRSRHWKRVAAVVAACAVWGCLSATWPVPAGDFATDGPRTRGQTLEKAEKNDSSSVPVPIFSQPLVVDLRLFIPLITFLIGCALAVAIAAAVMPSLVRRHSLRLMRQYHQYINTDSRIVVVHPPAGKGGPVGRAHDAGRRHEDVPDVLDAKHHFPANPRTPNGAHLDAQPNRGKVDAIIEQIVDQNIELRERILNP